jgi:hypothetical protein
MSEVNTRKTFEKLLKERQQNPEYIQQTSPDNLKYKQSNRENIKTTCPKTEIESENSFDQLQETKKKRKINLYNSGSLFTYKNMNIDSKKIDFIKRRNFFKKLNEMKIADKYKDEEILRTKYEKKINTKQIRANSKRQMKNDLIKRHLHARSSHRDLLTQHVL